MAILFKDIVNTSYSIAFIKGASEVATTGCSGSTTPITISEDSDDDAFKAVRTQSGYVTFVDTAHVWENMMPTRGADVRVELAQGGAAVWKGYVSPTSFDAPLFDPFAEVQIPIQCPLSALAGVMYEPSLSADTISFKDILDDILDSNVFEDDVIAGYDYGGVSFLSSFLSMQVSPGVFYNEDIDGDVQPKYSMLEVLEELATLMGVTIRWNGTTAVIEDITRVIDITAQTAIDVSALVKPGTNHTERMLAGWNMVTVTPDKEEKKNLFGVPSDETKEELLEDVDSDTWPANVWSEQNPNGYHLYSGHALWVVAELAGTAGGAAITAGGSTLRLYTPEATEHHTQVTVRVYDFYTSGNVPVDHKVFAWQINICIEGKEISGQPAFERWIAPDSSTTQWTIWKPSTPFFTAETTSSFAVTNCIVAVSADINALYENFTPGVECVYVSLCVGDLYYDGNSGWSSTETILELPVEGGKIKSNQTAAFGVGSYSGYGMTVNKGTVLKGKIMLKFYGGSRLAWEDTGNIPYGNHRATIGVQNLKIEVVRQESYMSTASDDYIYTNNSRFPDKKDVTTMFSSDDNTKFLRNVLLDSSGAPIEKISIGSSSAMRPELWLATRIGTYGATRRRVLDITARGILPILSDYKYNGRTYRCLSASYDHIENTTHLILIQ